MDARHLSAEEVISGLDVLGVEKAVIFPMNDPYQGPSFHQPNDLVWAAYQRYPDRVIPFFRLNPNFPASGEYELRVGQGFRGVKLHPRSQSFGITQPEAMEIYGWAEKDGLPILLHTGKGISSVVAEVRAVLDRFPLLRLILGHSARQDLPACCARCGDCDWVLFDTSTLQREQLADLMSRVEPEKIAYGSDVPFTEFGRELVRLLEVAAEVGLARESLEAILGGNLRRWMEEPAPAPAECELRGG